MPGGVSGNYETRLNQWRTYNKQRTFEIFDYFYPKIKTDKIIVNCAKCNKEATIAVGNFFLKKEEYICRSCNLGYDEKLNQQKTFNKQRTFDIFGYFYPIRSSDRIIINCAKCKKEGQLTTNEFLDRNRFKEYECRSCGSIKTEPDMVSEKYEESLKLMTGYCVESTKNKFGYEYPIKYTDEIIILCDQCKVKTTYGVGDLLRSWKDKKYYRCKKCRAKDGYMQRKDNMSIGRDYYWAIEENRDKVRQRALAESDTRRNRMIALNKSDKLKRIRAQSYIHNLGSMSKNEILLYYFFNALNVDFIPQWKPDKYKYDLYLPTHKLVIEYDGIMYHDTELGKYSRPKTQILKDNYIKECYSDHKLLRLSELEFYTYQWLLNTFSYLLPNYSEKNIDIKETNRDEIRCWATVFNCLKQRCDCAGHQHFLFQTSEGFKVGMAVVVQNNGINAVKCWALPNLRKRILTILKDHIREPITIENDSILNEHLEGQIIKVKDVVHYMSDLSGGIIAQDIFQRSLFGRPVESLISPFKLHPCPATISTLLIE